MNTLSRVALNLANSFQWLPSFFTRIAVGFVIVRAGWGKLHHIPKVVSYFHSLGIPYPEVQAPFVAMVELVCGTLLMIGLASRLVCIPLITIMVVVVSTARSGEVKSMSDLYSIYEFLYIILMFWIVTFGPGPVAIDHYFKRK